MFNIIVLLIYISKCCGSQSMRVAKFASVLGNYLFCVRRSEVGNLGANLPILMWHLVMYPVRN